MYLKAQTTKDLSEISNSLQCYLLPGRYHGSQFRKVYLETFTFWHSWWNKTFSEINISFSQTSDEFCRHDSIIALYKDDTIIGTALMDIFDLENKVHCLHKYFAPYPTEIQNIICQLSLGKPIYTFEYLAISPEYRKKYYVADLIVGVAVKKLIESRFNIMIGYSRNLRKTNELMYRLGAMPIQKDLIINNESSDFVYFNKKNGTSSIENHKAAYFIEKIWNQKIDESINITDINNRIERKGVYDEQIQL